jgi:hypothetical protein
MAKKANLARIRRLANQPALHPEQRFMVKRLLANKTFGTSSTTTTTTTTTTTS